MGVDLLGACAVGHSNAHEIAPDRHEVMVIGG